MLRFVFFAILLCIVAAGSSTAMAASTSQNLTIQVTGGTPTAFFVATNGSDSNAGTISAPFATFAKCKSAMDASSSVKLCYVRAGTYAMSSPFTFGSNEYFSVYPPDGLSSAKIDASGMTSAPAFHCSGCSNVALYGFDFIKPPTAAACGACAEILVEDGANTVYIDENSFDFPTIGLQYLIVFNSSNFYFRGNMMTQPMVGVSPNNGGCAVSPYYCNDTSWIVDDGTTQTNVIVSNNTFNGCINACIETGGGGTSIQDNFHIDYNLFENFQGLNNVCNQVAFAAISHIAPNNNYTQETNGTVYGNTFAVPSSTNNCSWALESVAPATYQNNTCNAGIGICFDNTSSDNQSVGAAFLGNTINTQATTEGVGCGSSTCAFSIVDAVNGEWIGTNTINGQSVSGCTTKGSPNYCAGAPYTEPVEPTLNTPSSPYNGSFP